MPPALSTSVISWSTSACLQDSDPNTFFSLYEVTCLCVLYPFLNSSVVTFPLRCVLLFIPLHCSHGAKLYETCLNLKQDSQMRFFADMRSAWMKVVVYEREEAVNGEMFGEIPPVAKVAESVVGFPCGIQHRTWDVRL